MLHYITMVKVELYAVKLVGKHKMRELEEGREGAGGNRGMMHHLVERFGKLLMLWRKR